VGAERLGLHSTQSVERVVGFPTQPFIIKNANPSTAHIWVEFKQNVADNVQR
jgi:hypothetical protein